MRFTLLLFLLSGASTVFGQCPDRLLMSAYFSGNVHVYDACSGQYERNLGTASQLAGAQASRIGPDGHLYVVAEDRGRIVRFNARSLEHLDDPVILPPGFGATGIDFRGNEIWIASYGLSLVRRFDLASGNALGDAVTAQAAGLRGADNGMTFGPDGKLYVPGFDSHSVVRHDPTTGSTSPFIASGAGGLYRTRGILFEPGGQTVLVSSEGNGRILRYDAGDGRFIGAVISGIDRPTGMAYDRDGRLLVAVVGGVLRVDPQSGANLGLLASAAAGQASFPTWVTVLPRDGAATTPVDSSQIGSQYWLTGAAPVLDKSIDIDTVVASFGAAFGADFDPAEVEHRRWGSARLRFTSCTRAEFSWDATGADSSGFGQGGYAIQRLLSGEATARCQQQGFANASGHAWMTGSWYGGEARNGEGLMLDVNSDGVAFLTWFTYRPR